MSDLSALITDYVAFRAARGFQLQRRIERLLTQFADRLPHDRDDGLLFSEADTLAWAHEPAGRSPGWMATRLSTVRGFAAYLAGSGLPVGVPAARQGPSGSRRATPYLYSSADIADLIAAADRRFTPLRAATMKTLVGLLAVTGLRIGEAVALTIGDLDLEQGIVLIRHAKYGRQRIVRLEASARLALAGYLSFPARCRRSTGPDHAVFVTVQGNPLNEHTAQGAFSTMVKEAGLPTRAGRCPRLHDFRHTFATQTMIDAYRSDGDPVRTLTLLSVWLGHSNPADTYWYLQAAPEIAAVAARRLEPNWGA
jgi:integrase/recombinase XerD